MDKVEYENRLSKIKQVDKFRLNTALQLMKKEVRDIVFTVPLLLHYNHPNIPGYRKGNVPFGIDYFDEINDFQKQYLLDHGVDPNAHDEKYHPIYGLYAMGSTSSIAQSINSDLDIWVCVSKDTSEEEIKLLSDKCHFINAYCKAEGAEVNLFVTPENRFLSGIHGAMDTEDCGSAQSLFLLDEFYRSSIRLTGRGIAWFMISESEENEDYNHYLEDFYNSDCVNRNDWFDFGSVAKCSPVEYFGSGLWLVYKGIDHPFKAVLKILLMEAYADEYPKTRLLSMELKTAIHAFNKDTLSADAYYLMYKKVENYLIRKKDFERLRIARFCFYLKVKNSFSHMSKSNNQKIRAKFLEDLVDSWNVPVSDLEWVDNADKWKIVSARKAQQKLLSALVASYRALLKFSVDHKIEYAITSDDAGVLSRKIYSAFDKYPGKIQLSNKEFLHLLEEDNLTFVNPSNDSLCRKGWHIYPTSLNSIDLLSTKAVYIAKSAAEVVSWATFNNLLTEQTNVFVASKTSTVTPVKIQTLSNEVKHFLDYTKIKVDEKALNQSRHIVKILLLVNFEKDVTQDFLITPSDLEIGSALSCGRQKMCLVGSVSMIFLNSWGEISCNTYPFGEDGLLEALATIVRIQSQTGNAKRFALNEVIKICSFSDYHKDLVRYDLESVLRGILGCNLDYDSSFMFNVGHNLYEATVDADKSLSIVRRNPFRASDDSVAVLSRFSMRPEFALQVPSPVFKSASIGILQYFFSKKEDGLWDIYIVNERNEVEIHKNFKGSRTDLVNKINRFYTQTSDRNDLMHNFNFNLPQYFILTDNNRALHPFTISNS